MKWLELSQQNNGYPLLPETLPDCPSCGKNSYRQERHYNASDSIPYTHTEAVIETPTIAPDGVEFTDIQIVCEWCTCIVGEVELMTSPRRMRVSDECLEEERRNVDMA